jgi:superfamily II DNA or RNA helicase
VPRFALQRTSVAAVKRRIALALLPPPNHVSAQLGGVTLRAHQLDGARVLSSMIERYGGAILADEVGLGKTYTALAVARGYATVDVVAPAALRDMWRRACERCGVEATFVSSESLSRTDSRPGNAALVVVDEAHWFRNAHTRRYRNVARRYRRARWLLLSATPVHNRAADLESLIALFRGRNGQRPNETFAVLLRRGRRAVPAEALPAVRPARWFRPRVDAALLDALRAITVPLPPRDAALAMGLLRLTLYRRLASTHAALRQSLQRLLGRAMALQDALGAGRYPSARELRAWLFSDDALQLALPGLLAPAGLPNEPLRLDAHIASLRRALQALARVADADARRVARLRAILRAHPDARIVAFSQFAATVRAFAAALRDVPGVAVLTAAGARIASGPVSRDELLRQFESGRPPARETMRIRLLLTTDVLSEGVNLQNASVLVHLDLPWTPARLEQRVGRLSRAGSPHREVSVYGFAPPNAVVRMERSVARLRVKYAAASRLVQPAPLLGEERWLARDRAPMARSECGGELRAVLTRWAAAHPDAEASGPAMACVHLAKPGGPQALALLQGSHGMNLVAVVAGRVSDAPRCVLRVARLLDCARPAAVEPTTVRRVRACVAQHVARRRGAAAALAPRVDDSRAMDRRLAEAVRALPRASRDWGLEMAVRIRGLLADAQSLGDQAIAGERCVELSARQAPPDDWLRVAHDRLAEVFSASTNHVAGDRERIAALLVGL